MRPEIQRVLRSCPWSAWVRAGVGAEKDPDGTIRTQTSGAWIARNLGGKGVFSHGGKGGKCLMKTDSTAGKAGHGVLLRFLKLVDVVLVTAIFGWVWLRFYADLVYPVPFYQRGTIVLILLYAFCYGYLAHLYDGFSLQLSRISELVFSQTLAAFIADGGFWFVIALLERRLPNVLPMLLCLVLEFAAICLWSLCAHRGYFRHHARKRTIVIYDELQGMEQLIKEQGLDVRYQVVDTVPVQAVDQAYLEGTVRNCEVVFLSSLHSHERNQIMKYCVAHGIRVFVIPRVGDVILSGAEKIHLLHLPMLLVRRYDPKPEYLFVKRLFDILLSGIALVVLSPLMVVLALIIKSDGGTAFYRQVRLTKDGREFAVLKFRSMRMDAEKDGVARLSSGENDPRITRVGRFIRACRMDELPQLLNILKGDMSIVGPRPERPEIARQYEETLPEFRLRLQCKCGLTGYAQVYGKYNSTPYDKLLMDLMYISHPSIVEDFKIILATVKILFLKDSTEGVAVGQTTAAD